MSIDTITYPNPQTNGKSQKAQASIELDEVANTQTRPFY